jgi:hypothetical protein
MTRKEYLVRTILLQSYFGPAGEMAKQRRDQTQDTQAMVNAMKRTQLADETLQRELQSFGDKGYTLLDLLRHPLETKNRYDLLVTAIFCRDAPDDND